MLSLIHILLIQMANIDELTAMLNRRAGKKALQETLEQARQQQLPVTICMYDINILKEINDHYGHNEGDFIITSIASMVKQHLGPHDYPFRLYSDEFILVFWDCQEAKAAQIMARIRKGLEENIELKQKPYEIGFCCGILEIPPDMILNLAEVLTLVDEKMYQQKRQLHIVKAEKARLSQHNQQISSQTFTYNQEYLYDALVQSTDDYIYVCNMQTGTFQYTPAMVEEFGLPGEIVQNAAAVWGAKIQEHDKQAFLESNQEITDNRTNHHCVEYRAQNRKGEWIWLRCRGYLERDEKGEPRLFAGFITNLGKKNKIDHVTGLFNKFEFEETVTHLLQEHPQKRLGLSLIHI